MNNNYYIGVGRRKEATARVYLKEGKGQAHVRTNNKNIIVKKIQKDIAEREKSLNNLNLALEKAEKDTTGQALRPSLCEDIFQPLKLFSKEKDYDFFVRVKGGGFHSQAEAIRLALARASLKISPEYKITLKSFSLLTRDARRVERKKVGFKKARKKTQFSKRHSHSANIKHRKDRQDSARSQLFLKVRKKIENIIREEHEVNEKSLSIARENEKIKNSGGENYSARAFYQAPFGILIYLEDSKNITTDLISKLKLKSLPLSSLSSYFQMLYGLKINLKEEDNNLEEYLLTYLPVPCQLVEKKETDYYQELKKEMAGSKFYTNVENWLAHTADNGEVGGSNPPIRRSRIQLVCGQAKPGASLAFLKNMALFCREFNEKTKERNGELVNVEIIVYEDKSYKYNIGTSPSVYLLKGRRSDYKSLKKEEKKNAREKEKKEISEAELEKIAREKMPDLNTDDLEKAKKIVAGTLRSYGNFKAMDFLRNNNPEKLNNIKAIKKERKVAVIKENLPEDILKSCQKIKEVELLTIAEIRQKPLQKLLGPKGIYPTKKNGLLTENILEEIEKFQQGKTEIKTDKGGNIHAVIGSSDFSPIQLEENYKTIHSKITELKPVGRDLHPIHPGEILREELLKTYKITPQQLVKSVREDYWLDLQKHYELEYWKERQRLTSIQRQVRPINLEKTTEV
ncbi:39215_t:CDS:10 [Gigaspora margarita]|uniref:39215_t:CDS:1 n=1 Tax=Gigaspora margarita TaxID=4874 RepID=A0ABN7UCD0_GIGMA|nr:39215_t:CDS:10 [Gigaspora margarita]